MANPTNPFNWQMPTATDLVTDLPADFETFGQAVATSMADLLGGTTGQVLSKASNTDMDFTWVAQDDSNAIQNAIVDAKGDLIAASAADTPARLAVGANGETLVADSSTATGLRYQQSYNGNAIINGGFDIWQRGTSFTAASVYTADRWFAGSQTTYTRSRQTSGLTGIQYSMRVQRDAGSTNTSGGAIYYNLETADSLRFAGQTVTVSFYAKAGANYSAASNALGFIVYTGTGTDQRRDQSNAFTGEVQVANPTITLTTSWQRFQFTAAIGATATEINLAIYSLNTGTAGANDWYEITGVQLEVGSVATTFKRSNGAGGSIQGELAACQRYYYRQYVPVVGNGFGLGMTNATTAALIKTTYPVTMRTSPTALDQTGTATDYKIRVADGSTPDLSTVPTFSNANPNEALTTFTVASGLTVGQAVIGRAAIANAYLGWSAEL